MCEGRGRLEVGSSSGTQPAKLVLQFIRFQGGSDVILHFHDYTIKPCALT